MKRSDKISRALLLLGILLLGVLLIAKPVYDAQDALRDRLISDTVQRALGSLIFLAATAFLGYRVWNRPLDGWLLAFVPALLVVANNFPIIGLATGAVQITRADLTWIYVLDCLMIGLFEEIAFRGTIFPALLESRRGSAKQIFWVALVSSALFGLLHLVNLLDGAGVGATLLQVGYSFLIGGMCTIVFLKCGNILPCILLHTLFDLGGRMVGTVADGIIWDAATVAITAVLGLAVAVWMLMLLLRIDPADTDCLFKKKAEKH